MDWTADADCPILVPRRADGGRRDHVWNLLVERVWSKSNVVVGEHLDGPFNRSAALNKAAAAAGAWDLAVIADADSFVRPEVLAEAVDLARASGLLVIAHSRWVNVDVDETDAFLATGDLDPRVDRREWHFTVSSMLVVPRTVWDAVNGFDERFTGWGKEDQAFNNACTVLTDEPLRLGGDVFHLAHERVTEDLNRDTSPLYIANWDHRQLYMLAETHDQMRALVAGNRVRELVA